MRIVIADDSALLREGIAQLLREAGEQVVATAGDAEELVAQVRRHAPDVVIVDIRMPPTQSDEGIVAAQRIRALQPGVGVLLLSQHVHAGRVLDLFETAGGGVGYLLKDRVTDVERFIGAVAQVASGSSVVDQLVVATLIGARRQSGVLDRLSQRESDVLRLMAQGRTNAAIARELNVAANSVEGYVNTIFTKLDLEAGSDANRRVLAVLAWLRAAG